MMLISDSNMQYATSISIAQSFNCKTFFTNFYTYNQKTEFLNFANSQYFFSKNSGITPWVGRINLGEGDQFCSTYMIVRLSNIRSIYC